MANTQAPQPEEPPTFILKASDPFALETLHYHITRCASAQTPDMMRYLAVLHSTAGQFARYLTPPDTVGEG